jgi:hypothetical protein
MASSAFGDFRHVLDVFPNQSAFTCVGTTRQGRRCRQSFISRSDLAQADRTLNIINQFDIYDSAFLVHIQPQLCRLADLTLCPRWHRDDRYGNSQRDQTVVKWLSMVERYRNEVLPVSSTSSSRSRSHRAVSATSSAAASSIRPSNLSSSTSLPAHRLSKFFRLSRPSGSYEYLP